MGRTNEALKRAEQEFQKSSRGKSWAMHERFQVTPRKQVKIGKGAECYQSLKTNLLGRYPDQCIKTLIFCSTAHGDGSTTTAVNFASTLAGDCKMKLLLVDANFRTPRIHELFHMDQSPGLSDYLVKGARMNLPMFEGGQNNLFVLPCGSNRPGPVRFFETKKFDRFLKEASERFDYVILDTPPLPAFAESRVICPKVNGVVLVVGAGKTRRQVAQRAKKELEASGGSVLGVVINRRKFHIPEWLYQRL